MLRVVEVEGGGEVEEKRCKGGWEKSEREGDRKGGKEGKLGVWESRDLEEAKKRRRRGQIK